MESVKLQAFYTHVHWVYTVISGKTAWHYGQARQCLGPQ